MGGWAGSLPKGFTPQRLADAVAETRAAGRLVALDCSGLPLRACAGAGRRPAAASGKPNAEELAEVTGRALQTLGDVADAARVLLARGVRTVLVSLGPRRATRRRRPAPSAPLHRGVRRVVNTVGAGDAFLAGWLAAVQAGATHAEALANALRFGAAAVEQEGTLLGGPDPAAGHHCPRSGTAAAQWVTVYPSSS